MPKRVKRKVKRKASSRSPSRPFQLGGARRIGKNGKEQVYIIQDGKGFWGDAWKWVKGAAGTVHDVVKKSGVLGRVASTVPGLGGVVAGTLARQAGYGYQQGGLIAPLRGNAAQSMPFGAYPQY